MHDATTRNYLKLRRLYLKSYNFACCKIVNIKVEETDCD